MADTMRNPTKLKRVLERMMKMRDPKGVYADGGCLDSTREYPKQIFPRQQRIASADLLRRLLSRQLKT
jgi:hypothetical protein